MLHEKFDELQAGAIIVVKNRSGPLDLARTDPMAMNKSQYRIGRDMGAECFIYT